VDTVSEQVNDLIESHCRVVHDYQTARITVAGWETYSVLEPGQVDRLEARLAGLYETLHDQSAELARISALLEFGQ
jgi:hypothetical protein